MLIYNITIQVEKEIAENWLLWLKDEHIPEVLETGCFIKYQLVKLIDVDESETVTYAVQYYAENHIQLDRYLHEHAAGLRKKGIDRWNDRFVAFRTIMEVVK